MGQKHRRNHVIAYDSTLDLAFLDLTQRRTVTVSRCSLDDVLRWGLWFAVRYKRRSKTFYAVTGVRVNGQTRHLTMHTLLYPAPPGLTVDHIDGDGLNNALDNLRHATESQSNANRRGWGEKSKWKGVYYDKRSRRWRAMIGVNNKLKHLGYYPTEEEAAYAYAKAARETFGDFVRAGTLIDDPLLHEVAP